MQEDQNIEFKESWRDEYLKWICAFANSQGGKLLIGVRDDGSIAGLSDAKRLMEDLPNKIASTMGIICDVNLLKRDGRDYLEIVVEPSNMPIAYHGVYHVRSGSTKQELKGAALQQFLLRKMGRTWDSISNPFATLDEISPEAIDYFQRAAIRHHRMSEDAYTKDVRKVLKNLELLDHDGSLTNAALLAFGKNPSRYFPLCEFFIGRFGASQSDLKFQDEIKGNLIQMTDRVIETLGSKYLIRPIHYEGLFRSEPLELPEDALREAILNAIIHKDYTTVHIQMRVWNDRLELWNPGPLPDALPIDKINEPHSSYPRNPNLAKVFYMAGLIEHWGRGIDKIRKLVADDGLKNPKFVETCGGIQITFYRDLALQGYTANTTKQAKEKAVTDKSKEPPTKTTEKNYRKKKKKDTKTTTKTTAKTSERILDLLKQNPYSTLVDMANILQLSCDGVRWNIRNLKKQGLLIRHGGNKGGHWVVVKKDDE